jgi:hypothetical protein
MVFLSLLLILQKPGHKLGANPGVAQLSFLLNKCFVFTSIVFVDFQAE